MAGAVRPTPPPGGSHVMQAQDRVLPAMLAWVQFCHAVYGPNDRPKLIRLVMESGQELTLPVPVLTVPKPEEDGGAPPVAAKAEPARHSDDFRTVHWFGERYTFNSTQAAVVRVLWKAWEAGTPGVATDTLLEEAGTSGSRLRDIFKGHTALGTLFVQSGKGVYRLDDEA